MMDVYTRIHILPDKQDEIKIKIEKGRRLRLKNVRAMTSVILTFRSAEELRTFAARISEAIAEDDDAAEREAEND